MPHYGSNSIAVRTCIRELVALNSVKEQPRHCMASAPQDVSPTFEEVMSPVRAEAETRRKAAIRILAAFAVLAGILALADPSSRSNLSVVQGLNPYLIGALSIGTATVAAALYLSRTSNKWGSGIIGGCVCLGLTVAGVLSLPPSPVYTLEGPGNGLVLLVTRDAAFLDPTFVVTVQRPAGLGSQEWYLTCFDNFPGFYSATWVSGSQLRLSYGDAGSHESKDFFVNPETGEPDATGTCNASGAAHRPGIRSPR